MEDLDFILDWTEKLKISIEELPFGRDDIRIDFLGMLYDAAYNYYRGYIGYKMSGLIKNGDILFKEEKTAKLDRHIRRFLETSISPILSKSQCNYLNRHFLTDVWSTFELCVTILVEALIDKDDLDKMLLHHYKDIRKCFKNSVIDEVDMEALIASTKKSHLTHVPVTRKTDFLFRKSSYFRNTIRDKEFLIFLGKWRNTMHSNYIYFGKDYKYEFGNAVFLFKNGEMVKWIDPFEPSPKLYFHIMGNLRDIWVTLIKSIKHEATIPYPDPDQE